MKKIIYALILPLVVVSGLVFANREIKQLSAQADRFEVGLKPSKVSH